MYRKNTLILFAKAAQICNVKTRMYPALTHRECLYLHKQSIDHFIKQFKDKFNLVFYTTHTGQYSIPVKEQCGIDLGVRMLNAMKEELKDSERVVLIGSDCLQLDIEYVNKAFSSLQSVRDIVLGPANDGGYFLIGANRVSPSLFHNVSWGTSGVLTKTLMNIADLGWNAKILDALIDVDTFEDLLALQKLNALPNWARNFVEAKHIA